MKGTIGVQWYKVKHLVFKIILVLVTLSSLASAMAADTILYDGEPGSAPLLGGNWAVGASGTLLHNDGAGWKTVTSPTIETLRAIAKTGDTKIWAAGDRGTLIHLDAATLTWVADASPTINDLYALRALSPTDIWVAGQGGTVLHNTGSGWTLVITGYSTDLYGINAVDSTHVWAVGAGGLILFYNGSIWTIQTSGTTQILRSIHVLNNSDAWAVGDAGTILHWNGTVWSPVSSGTGVTLHSVWAASTNHAWAVGEGGLILHWNNSVWTPETSSTSQTLYTVHGMRDNYLDAAGAQGVLLHYDYDRVWRAKTSPTSLPLYAISIRNVSALAYLHQAVGEGRGGGNALELDPDPWHEPSYLLYCGDGGRRDFSPYSVIEFYFRSPEADPGNPTFRVITWNYGSRTINILDYIEGGIIDNTWRRVRIPIVDLATPEWNLGNVERLFWNKDSLSRTYFVDDIALRNITPPVVVEEAFTVESNTVLRLTMSERYEPASVRPLTNYSLSSLTDPSYSTPANPVDTGMHYRFQRFGSGNEPINRYYIFLRFATPLINGHQYTLSVEGITNDSGIPMARTQLSFAYNDTIQLNPNIKVNQVGYLPDRPKFGYVGGYLGDMGGGAWTVGDGGMIFAWDDQNGWQNVTSPVNTPLRAVAATREDNVWAVGDGGVMVHWDGSHWTQTASLTSADLLAITFGPTGIGWAVGAEGVSLRYNPKTHTWTQVSTPTFQTLRGVWAGFNDTAWVVGDGGTILLWNGSAWVNDEHPTNADLYAINGPGEPFAVGANGTVLYHQYGHWKIAADTPGGSATLRAIGFDYGGGIWVGGDGGLLWNRLYSGSPFTAQTSGTTATLHALARLDGRQFWGVGDAGTLISRTTGAWVSESLPAGHLYGLFALPYGPLRLSDPPPDVTIKDMQTGAPVLTVSLALRAANWHLSGEDVYAFDFSALSTPGTYQAYVPGFGLSDPFVISEDALNIAAYTTARGFYYQRCGTAITEPYADPRFARPICHEYDLNGRRIDAAFHSYLPNTSLYNGEIPGDMIDVHGGWHDAGDYGKYIPTAAVALWHLFTAYDIAPEQFQDNVWNIPESGNGVPDLLDETRWEVDWIARIQAADGGVYNSVSSVTWYGDVPFKENTVRYLFERTTSDTALAAAIFASASRLWAEYDPSLAVNYLERAQRAWAFLQAHPDTTPAGGFHLPEDVRAGEYKDSDDSDNRLWAAAELYRTTGETQYRQHFDDWCAHNYLEWGWHSWTQHYKSAYWAYLRALWPDASVSIQNAIRQGIIGNANGSVAKTYAAPYLIGARLDVPMYIGYGTFSHSTAYAFPLLQAWAITGDDTYRDAAALNLDVQLGANPLSLSFITGLGARYPQDPTHNLSVSDGVDEPIPGLPVFGVATHMPNSEWYYRLAQSDENNYPYTNGDLDPYPILRRYADDHHLVMMGEFTILEMAVAASVFNLLSQPPQILGSAPIEPVPLDVAMGVVVTTSLRWKETPGATDYDLYLWKFGYPKPDIPTASGIADTIYQPVSALDYGTTYQWQVVAKAGSESKASLLWSFITQTPYEEWVSGYPDIPVEQRGPNADPDTDGLTNENEFVAGTDPTNPDTDGDGFSDGSEVEAGSDPLNPSSNPPATLVITSVPSGAGVYLDGNYGYLGQYYGVTDTTLTGLPAGKHFLAITLPGYEVTYSLVDLAADATTEVAVVLTMGVIPQYSKESTLNDIYELYPSSCPVAPFVVDWNLDDRKDLLISDALGELRYYENSGTDEEPAFSAYTTLLSGLGMDTVVFVVDWNNDGKQDLLIGNGTGNVTLYLNTGTVHLAEFGDGVVIATVGNFAIPRVVDWNNDYRKDLVVGDGNGALSLFLNSGTDASPVLEPPVLVSAEGAPIIADGGNAAPWILDWDSDGRKDLLVGCRAGELSLYLNTGTDAVPAFAAGIPIKAGDMNLSVGRYSIPLVMDWDKDALKDLVIGSQTGWVYLFLTLPIVNAGPDITIKSIEQLSIVLEGFASDCDNDPLTYRWLEGEMELLGTSAVDSNGSTPLDLSTLPLLALGEHILTLEVSDGKHIVTDSMILTLHNSIPSAAPLGGGVYEYGSDITLGGTVHDFDGDNLQYSWYEGESLIASGSIATHHGGAPATLPGYIILGGLPIGEHLITLVVSDNINSPISAELQITMIDTAKPTLSPEADITILWPPDHTMRDVTIHVNAFDDSGTVSISSVEVFSNEPPSTDEDGNIIPDYTVVNIDQATGVIHIQLRAERSGQGSGREYTVHIGVSDPSGNSSMADLVIKVPHDQGKKK